MNDLRWILDDLPIGVWVGAVPDGIVAYANHAFEAVLGMPSAASSKIGDVPQTYGIFDRRGHPYPVEKLPFSQVMATRAPVMVDDIIARRPSGNVNIRAFGAPVFSPAGALTHVIVAFLDITPEVAAKQERDRVEAQLRFVCNHAPLAIWCTDTEGIITLSEGAGLAVLGVKPGALVGMNVLDVYGGHPTIPGYIRRGLAGESFWYTAEVGEAVYETWLAPLFDDDGKRVGMAGVSNDVSQLRKLQRTAIQSDRVMALGTLAASVAHEINNPLTYVLSYGDMVAAEIDKLEALLASGGTPAGAGAGTDLGAGAGAEGAGLSAARASLERIRDGVASIRAGTSRIAAVTRDLRTFSRPDETNLSPVDPRKVVSSVLRLIGKEIEARARLIVELQETPPVIGNEARLVQVLLNMMMNALQALPQGPADTGEVAVRITSEGTSVVIEVSDSGPGVPAADRERIFEPFFTTKEIGVGTGLGLFVCRNIVRGMSGEVEVGDRPGGGALFRVTLPAGASAAPTPEPAAGAPDAAPVTGGGHVVLVEDDPMVARSLAQALRRAGYRVTLLPDAQSGFEALCAATDVDLVFCDLMMTGMTGMELAERLQVDAPEILRKTVFMTGGAFSSRAREFVGTRRENVVDKPFDVVAETRRRLQRG